MIELKTNPEMFANSSKQHEKPSNTKQEIALRSRSKRDAELMTSNT